MVAENTTSSARLITALLARGFDLPAAVRELNLPAADLLTLARDENFREQLHDLRSLMVELAHLHALSTLQRLTSSEADPIEQRRACSAILRFRAHPDPDPAPPSAQCPVPSASSSSPTRHSPLAIPLPCSDTADAFMEDIIDILEPGPGQNDDLDDPETLDHPDSPIGRAMRALHACLVAHGPGATLDGREVPHDPSDFIHDLDPAQIRELTGFAIPLRTIEIDEPDRRVERVVLPRRGGGECNFRRFTLIRAGPGLPWRLQTVAPYKPGSGDNPRW